jgi:hypothetical protein
MRRTLKLAALTLLVLLVAVVVLVENRADEKLPPPDPATPIRLQDGTFAPLAEVLERARAGTLIAPRKDEDERKVLAEPDPELEARIAGIQAANLANIQAELEQQPPVFRLAEVALDEGRLDEAMALYASLPEDDPYWPRAQRRIAWDILTQQRGQPQQAVRYAQAALAAEPLEGNSWQDLARVYAGTLGFEVD